MKIDNHAAWIEIDCAQFRKNLTLIKQSIGKETKLCLPVKANAYGHGLKELAPIAQDLVDYFGVSCLREGVALRQVNINKPILLFGAIDEEQIEDAIIHDLEITLSSLYKAQLVHAKAAALNKPCSVQIEVETGMQRTGIRIDSLPSLIEFVIQSPYLSLKGIYSHFATADQPNHPQTYMQLQRFDSVVKHYRPLFNDVIFHIANSGGLAYYPQSHYDMVRPGILVYGYLPCLSSPMLTQIKPFFTLKARITFFKVVQANQGISYNHHYTTTSQTRIVTIPIGYGDGYRRALSNKADVLIHGKRYPVAGIICMDQFMVDLGQDTAYVGDEVVLIGTQGQQTITLQEIAERCDTITYEILCGLNDRLVRNYLNNYK